MAAFANSLGRFNTIRKRDSRRKSILPIDLDAAKQYTDAGPSSTASSSLLTPKPHHYRSSTPSPATSAASSFESSSASTSTRSVSSPTFLSSTALLSTSALPMDLDSFTPPLSPVHLNTAAAAKAIKSPLRRALSRTFFFGKENVNPISSVQAPTLRISSPAAVARDNTRASPPPPPARPARPTTSPATSLSPKVDAFGFTATSMARSRSSGPVIITDPHDDSINSRRRTLMSPAAFFKPQLKHSKSEQLTTLASNRASSPTWSPLPTSPSSPHSSLRTVRQLHARKSIFSIFQSPTPPSRDLALDVSTPSGRAITPDALPPRLSSRRRLTRRASDESFHCRGLGFDAPPAADTRPSIEEPYSTGFYTRASASVPRCVSMYSTSYNTSAPSAEGNGARRMSDFTISSFQEASINDDTTPRAVYSILHEVGDEMDGVSALAGLGLVDTIPPAPRFVARRLSATSLFSLTDSIPWSVPSASASTASFSSIERDTQSWFSTCPPTPPSSIRLQLEFRSLPLASPALRSVPIDADQKPARPLSGIFISSNSSVLDLKETISTRMHELGYRISPKNLSLTLHLNEDVRTNASTALGLKLSAFGKNPAKVLDDSSRLLFEEGAQEEDLVVVDCDPSHILWSI